jgi:hypothetical protein
VSGADRYGTSGPELIAAILATLDDREPWPTHLIVSAVMDRVDYTAKHVQNWVSIMLHNMHALGLVERWKTYRPDSPPRRWHYTYRLIGKVVPMSGAGTRREGDE